MHENLGVQLQYQLNAVSVSHNLRLCHHSVLPHFPLTQIHKVMLSHCPNVVKGIESKVAVIGCCKYTSRGQCRSQHVTV